MLPTIVPERLRGELERTSRLLLIRMRSLGDSILVLPLIEALHAWRPDLGIDVLVEAPFAPVFSSHPAVHEALILKAKRADVGGWSRARAVYELRRRSYRVAVNLHGGTTSALLSLASGAAFRVGQEGYRNVRAYNAMIPRSSRVWGRDGLHTVEHQLSLMRWLSLPVPEQPRGPLHIQPAAAGRVEARLREAGISAFFVVHPTATLATKQWPEENFAAVADRLSAGYGLPVILTAAPSESQVLVNVARYAGRRHHYWTDLSVAELFALIGRCRLFVGNDSGPTHAAAALGKPIVVVWGSSNRRAWHPWGTSYEIVASDFPCIPCPGYTCAAFGRPRCILEVPVDPVVQACDRMLEE